MSTVTANDVEVGVIGAGVVGAAVALALARRGVSVALLEAEPEVGLGASATNSGILHTGFDSPSGELETQLILRSAVLRETLLDALHLPVLRCGALMRPGDDRQRQAVAALADAAERNGVTVVRRPDGMLEIPGESVTDPVLYTLALVAAAQRHGCELRVGWRVGALERKGAQMLVCAEGGETLACSGVVNCAGLYADAVAGLAGDRSFAIFPRKGEFLVFDVPAPDRILLPVPSKRTKGVLVFPTIDGKLVAGPTAADQDDKRDWSVRPEAGDQILAKAIPMYPPLEGAEPIGAYAGLRPAGRGVNYVIAVSAVCDRLVNVAAIRSTGLSASLGIAERVTELVASIGVMLGAERELIAGPLPAVDGPWWRRAALHRAAV